jgi:hypothetical protein
VATTDIHGFNRDDMVGNAKIYIDQLLRPNKSVVLPLSYGGL